MSDWVEATDPKTQRKYYYNKSTKKTQWTRPAEMDGGAATPVASSNGGGGGDEPENNPAFWAESKDPKTGRTYYYNKQTKKTQWTKPACLSADGAATPAATPASSTPPGAGSSAISAAPASTSLANAPLPSSSNLPASTSAAGSEWRETLDPKSGRKYWYNKVTKETTWKDPTGAAAAPTPASATATPSGSSLSIAASAGSSSSGAAGATPLRAQLDSDNEDDEADNILSSGIGGDGGGDAAAASGSGGANNAAHDDEDEDDHEDDSRPASGGGAGASAESAPEEKYDDSEEAQASRAKQMLSMLRDDSDDEGRGGRGGGDDDDNDKGDSDAMKQKQAQHARDVNDVKSKLKNDEEVDEAEAHDKLRFAKHRHGFFNRLLRRGETFGENKLLSFKKSLIKKALLKQNRDLDAEAVQAFKNIMSYMGDRKSSKQPLEHSKKLIRNLMMAPSGLRDEVYLQICKQTTQNPHMESLVKGWELMSFCLATFPPSKYLKNFLNDYLKKAAEDSSKQKVQSLAQICLERLPKIVQMGQRKQVPSTLELQCLMDAKPIPIRVNLVNGTFKTFTVDPYTTCKELEEMLIKKYNITLIEILALYEGAEDNVERILDPKDRVLDVMASWENKPLMEELKVDPKAKAKVDPKKQPQQLKVEKKEPKYNSFLYKAKLVLKTTNKELMSDPEAVNMVYIQATHDVVTTRYPCNEKDVTVLAALQLQATYGDYKKDVHVPGWLKTRIEEFMPASLLENRGKKSDSLVAEWEQKILAKYMKLNGFSSMDAKLNYLEYVQEWVFYGSSFFLIEQRQFKDYPSPLLMGINCEGVLLMHPEKKTVLENYQYTDIVTWGHSDEKFILVVGNIVQQRKLIFKTSDGKVMNHLIHDYVKFKVKSKEAQT